MFFYGIIFPGENLGFTEIYGILFPGANLNFTEIYKFFTQRRDSDGGMLKIFKKLGRHVFQVAVFL